ncbi:helix-turn-helix domain-containing protein [Mycobacteroides abscessus]|uniref:hypothetical protein n=1 Tax=Mycobacteroides abscessus TaxID=36809 RepID=UPI0009A6BCFE|nr:hypothetical protein [Mycobacteroides abscessus]SKI75994.1 Uncharacterised protein [Mycobacteroides abscessus subsp. massiliense]SKM56381.1 Uncharacterised protein [Mycobacteroides abscessus subsp. massiliense]SKP98249.1 Uncharacterised protein [Mycobacteroides abscessus subsp. massiliense]SKQ07874.1 Uncharacterised protein [Mycobacteroides abscessus subsp. massiliense]SLL01245.1 Uncharacterised protein [Mycobacteroides abscessus subsp. massiliense]
MSDAQDESVLARVADIQRREAPARRRQWIRRVLGCTELSAAQRNVLLALETFADYLDGSNAHPGETNLAEICGLTTRAVRTALGRGCELGLIRKTANENPRASRAAVYRLLLSDESTTGTAVPVKDPTTGTAVPVYNPHHRNGHDTITGTAVPPTKSSTKTTGVLRNSGTSPEPCLADTHPDRPSRFCDEHPMGTRGNCGNCANARTAFNAWQDHQAERDAEIAQADAHRRHQLRVTCPWCHGTNLRDLGDDLVEKCDHKPPQARRTLSLVPPLPGGPENVRAAQ